MASFPTPGSIIIVNYICIDSLAKRIVTCSSRPDEPDSKDAR